MDIIEVCKIRDEIATIPLEDLAEYVLREIPNGQIKQLSTKEGGTEWGCYALPEVEAVCYGETMLEAILRMWLLCKRLNVLHP